MYKRLGNIYIYKANDPLKGTRTSQEIKKISDSKEYTNGYKSTKPESKTNKRVLYRR